METKINKNYKFPKWFLDKVLQLEKDGKIIIVDKEHLLDYQYLGVNFKTTKKMSCYCIKDMFFEDNKEERENFYLLSRERGFDGDTERYYLLEDKRAFKKMNIFERIFSCFKKN